MTADQPSRVRYGGETTMEYNYNKVGAQSYYLEIIIVVRLHVVVGLRVLVGLRVVLGFHVVLVELAIMNGYIS